MSAFSSPSLGNLKVGDRATLVATHGSDGFVRRIQEMGMVAGEPIEVIRKAPLGDPIVIRVHGYQLGLRKHQAQQIEVKLGWETGRETSSSSPYEGGQSHGLKHLAILGNPNCGKTTVFNALTGMKQKVGNYAGVTVEKRTGICALGDGSSIDVIDLPGTYSLEPTSPDEKVAVDVLTGARLGAENQSVDGVLVILDASNLARNLFLFTQVAESGLPLVVGLTMMDTAERCGKPVDVKKLENYLGVPVVPLNAKKGQGIETLKKEFSNAVIPLGCPWQANESPAMGDSIKESTSSLSPEQRLDISQRYRWIAGVVREVIGSAPPKKTITDSLDSFLVHRIWGLLVFALIMTSMFYMIYVVADPLMGAAEDGVAALGDLLFGSMNDGPLKSLLVDGIIGGVGGVLVFVPQIAVLFFCISLLEESGYLARATFLLDRILALVGLHGKSFIPLLSSHACAIPGIMAARSIESHRDRLATMFVAPFMSCGARLPVYALLIGVFLKPYGAFVQGLTLMSCYSLGIFIAVFTALLLKKTALRAPPAAFLLELPHYQFPEWMQVARIVFRHSFAFVRKAGTVILGFSILLWAALYYPRMDEGTRQQLIQDAGWTQAEIDRLEPVKEAMAEIDENLADVKVEILQAKVLAQYGVEASRLEALTALEEHISGRQTEQSWAGRAGKFMEPLIEPMGYDWKMGIGLIGAFAAREVFVSTMGIVYSVGEADEESESLHEAMRSDLRADGTALWTIPTVLSVLVFFVIAMQCISTVAVMKKETGGWKWPIIQLVSMNLLAFVLATIVFQVGTALGWGT